MLCNFIFNSTLPRHRLCWQLACYRLEEANVRGGCHERTPPPKHDALSDCRNNPNKRSITRSRSFTDCSRRAVMTRISDSKAFLATICSCTALSHIDGGRCRVALAVNCLPRAVPSAARAIEVLFVT